MTLDEAKKQVKDLLDRLEASEVNLSAKAHSLSLERGRDVRALRLVLGEEGTGLFTGGMDECPMCGV